VSRREEEEMEGCCVRLQRTEEGEGRKEKEERGVRWEEAGREEK
jgi:hypothetical protein